MRIIKRIIVFILALLFPALTANAVQMNYSWDRPVGFIAARSYTSAPEGFLDFCKRYPEDCKVSHVNGRVDLTVDRMRELNTVNSDVNDTLFFNSDISNNDYWDYPQDNIGDCEDFVIEKRKRLMDMGWPENALLITMVRRKTPDFAGRTSHAVLTARTAQGDYILDNEIRSAVAWNVASSVFDYVMMQTETDPRIWALVDSSIDSGTRLH